MGVKPIVLALAGVAFLAASRPAPGIPVADPICVFAGPLDVGNQQVVPYIQQCLPTA